MKVIKELLREEIKTLINEAESKFGVGDETPAATQDRHLDLTKPRFKSHFCEHNPAVNKFAMSGPDEFASTLIFAIASQQRDWAVIYGLYPLIIDYLKGGGDPTSFKGDEFPGIGYAFQGKGKYIKPIWENRNSIFAHCKAIYDDELALYKYIVQTPGLGPVKAGFAMQLIRGVWGCLDSINQRFYGNEIKLPTGSDVKTKERGVDMYVEYLNNLEKLYNEPISQKLWDDWCDIVAHRLQHSGISKPSQVSVGLHKGEATMDTYNHIGHNYKYLQNPDTRVKTGSDVSREHGETIMAPFDSQIRQRVDATANRDGSRLPLREAIRHMINEALEDLRKTL